MYPPRRRPQELELAATPQGETVIDFTAVSEALAQDPERLLNALGIEYYEGSGLFGGRCPIHGGDNANGFTLYENSGIWRCWTSGCHNDVKFPNCLGLIHAMLSSRADKPVKIGAAVDWAMKFLGDVELKPIVKNDASIKLWGKIEKSQQVFCQQEYANKLIIPSPYFIGRGFTEDLVRMFGAGDPKNKYTKMGRRAIVPVYCAEGINLIGFSGRAYDWTKESQFPKWYHFGFPSGTVLYNYARALPEIERTKSIVLVEGPLDVWALWKNGVRNAVAVFGDCLKEGQVPLIEKSPALKIRFAFDNDEAGNNGFDSCKKLICQAFEYDRIRPVSKDWEATPPDYIRKHLEYAPNG